MTIPRRIFPSAPANPEDRRVQIPTYMKHWMMGDRFGEIVRIIEDRVPIKGKRPLIAHVRLDKSGKTVRVMLDDCTGE